MEDGSLPSPEEDNSAPESSDLTIATTNIAARPAANRDRKPKARPKRNRQPQDHNPNNALQLSHSQSRGGPIYNALDYIRTPNLIAKALDLQTKGIFSEAVSQSLFPATFAAYRYRVDQDVTGFVRDDIQAQCPAVEWTVRCLTMWYLATKHADQDSLNQSRYIYGVLLKYLSSLLVHPRWVRSDALLVATILVSVYEMIDGVRGDSWLIHTRAVKQLFLLRGAEAHYSGFGRTLFMSYRAFLVADAFFHGEVCFLEGGEWKSMVLRSLQRDERVGRGGRLARVMDQAFLEIVRGPGFLVRVRGVLKGDNAEREDLVVQVRNSRRVLLRLQEQLAGLLGRDVRVQGKVEGEGLGDGPIELEFVPMIARMSARGISFGLALLEKLRVMLATDTEAAGQIMSIPCLSPDERLGVNDNRVELLDEISLTMGTCTLTDTM